MRKKIIKALSIGFVFSLLYSFMVLAAPAYSENKVPPNNTKLLPPNQTYSIDTFYVLTRGSIISTCTIRISNEGGGAIGIFAETLAHSSIDWGYITIYLDRWVEEEHDWINYEKYEFEFLPENEATGELHAMAVDFDETNQPAGYYYRLWSYHEVEKNGVWQAKKVATDGVMITK